MLRKIDDFHSLHDFSQLEEFPCVNKDVFRVYVAVCRQPHK